MEKFLKKAINLMILATFFSCNHFSIKALKANDSEGLSNEENQIEKTSPFYKIPQKPESLEQERPVVSEMLNGFIKALASKDIDKALEFCSRKTEYKKLFTDHPELMIYLSEALKNFSLDSVGPGYTQYGCRIGGGCVKYQGKSFHLNLVKINGKWLIQDF